VLSRAKQNLVGITVPTREGGPSATPRTVIRIPKTAEILAAQIRKMIIRGEVKEGDFLPPEGQLVAHFGTSRPTVREAFRILENEQLITVVRGSRSGARVNAPSVASVARIAGFALQAQGTLLSDVYLVRVGVEPFAARLAAERATPEQMVAYGEEVDRAMLLLEETGANREFRMAIVHLHRSMVAMAGSNSLAMIWAMIQGIVEQHMARFRLTTPDIDPQEALRLNRAGVG
jgi:DNA-binding FadR family transcriptional regulator